MRPAGDPGALQPEIAQWIESVTGLDLVAARQIPAGGRLGWFIDVSGPAGPNDLFLQLGRGSREELTSFRGFETEVEVYRALRPHGIPVPKVWGYDSALDVLLVDRIPGSVWFHPPADESEQLRVAQDFIRHIAAWHRLGTRALDIPSLGAVKTLPEHQRDQLAGVTSMLTRAGGPRLDPLVDHANRWLASNIPDEEGPVVLVQGDTGPGNFLYENGLVTGVIDWELAHFGDPMDDIAWMSWRATQHGFTDFPARLREYEKLSGIDINAKRVFYYRLNAFGRLGAEFGLPSMGHRRTLNEQPDERPEVDRAADGSALILSMLHRRMRLSATADAMGLDKPSRDLTEAPEPRHTALYDRVLDQLRSMVPRIEDRAAANTAKAVARQVKYLKELDRNGGLFREQELDDLGGLLRSTQPSASEGRAALVDAVYEGAVSFEDYVDYHWRRLFRDDHLMRLASGALYDRGWPELS